MARTISKYPGDRTRVAVAAGLTTGEFITIGGKPAVLLDDRDAAGLATVQFRGIVKATLSIVVAVGDLLFLDADGGTLSADTEDTPFGIALEAIASGSAEIDILLLSDAPGALVDADGVGITIGAEAADVITVSLQFKKGTADATTPVPYSAWLSAASDGQVVKAAATTLAAGTDGTILVEKVANAVWDGVSEADGDADIAIGDAVGADTYFLNIVLPTGRRVVSPVITFAA